jgi:putative acyl-CoA dehydrogenase
VLNQAEPASGFNAFTGDVVLREAIAREAAWATERCAALAPWPATSKCRSWRAWPTATCPNSRPTTALATASTGSSFHPSWHELMTLAWQHEVPNLSWRTAEKNRHVARAVLSYLWNQVEQGTACPTGMAYAAYAGFEAEPALAIWAEKSRGTVYEFSRREVATSLRS